MLVHLALRALSLLRSTPAAHRTRVGDAIYDTALVTGDDVNVLPLCPTRPVWDSARNRLGLYGTHAATMAGLALQL